MQPRHLARRSILLTCLQAFLLFDDLDRSQWSRRTSESRDAYTALKAHYLKYIEHPDDLPSTIDPLADDAEVCYF
jgi:TBC1 domain family protein 5